MVSGRDHEIADRLGVMIRKTDGGAGTWDGSTRLQIRAGATGQA
ncbi:hypothetical protein [Streptomyces sp. NPDC002580]